MSCPANTRESHAQPLSSLRSYTGPDAVMLCRPAPGRRRVALNAFRNGALAVGKRTWNIGTKENKDTYQVDTVTWALSKDDSFA